MAELVTLSREGPVATLTLRRPPLNVINLQMMGDLGTALGAVGDAAILVLQGDGEKAFSAGVDIADHTPDKVAVMLRAFHTVLRQLTWLEAVTVSAIRGACLGGGAELGLATDLVVAADDAKLALPEINVGCYPPVAIARWGAAIGAKRTAELVLTGRNFTAAEGHAWGLINRVVPAARLDEAVRELVASLREKSPAVLKATVRALRAAAAAPDPEQALDLVEALYQSDLCRLEDMQEGLAAFLQKRKPAWKGR